MSVYLDHNATCPMPEPVLDAMRQWFGVPANPSSAHAAGRRARQALERARTTVAAFVGRPAAGLVFTSGATEANQLWMHGILATGARRIGVGPTEHPSVRAAAAAAAARGAAVVDLAIDRYGRVTSVPDGLDAVAVMAANHETGVVQPPLAHPVRHVDATQAAGRLPLRLADAHAVTLSAHKLGGPVGVGALSLRDGAAFPPLFGAGSQERGRRPGTVNVAGIVGFAAACALASAELEARADRWRRQQARLEAALRAVGADIVGDGAERLPQTTLATFPGVPGEAFVSALDLAGIAVSAGAACASGSTEASPVLLALGHPSPDAGVRFSLGPTTTDADIDRAIDAVLAIAPQLRAALTE